MGGLPPLGYKPDGRTLEIVPEHADIVRDIFKRYLDTGNVRLLVERLSVERIHTPVRQMANGRTFGGVPFSRGADLRHPQEPDLYRRDPAPRPTPQGAAQSPSSINRFGMRRRRCWPGMCRVPGAGPTPPAAACSPG